MTQVIKISKEGYNVITETNPDNLIYSSEYNTLKYYISGSTSVSVTSGSSPQVQETTIATHNLGYRPFFTATIKFSTNAYYYNLPLSFADGGYWAHDFIYTTTTEIIYQSYQGNIWSIPTTAFSATIYYKIFRNNLNL